jgi:hypothetical protein
MAAHGCHIAVGLVLVRFVDIEIFSFTALASGESERACIKHDALACQEFFYRRENFCVSSIKKIARPFGQSNIRRVDED